MAIDNEFPVLVKDFSNGEKTEVKDSVGITVTGPILEGLMGRMDDKLRESARGNPLGG